MTEAVPVILVVDDVDYLRSMLDVVLRQAGYAVLQAATGEEALEVYRRHPGAIHLVLLDLHLPGQGGRATLERLRALDPQVRCCLMSGGQEEYTEEDLRRLGALGRVHKPFRVADLLQLLARLVPRTHEPG
jgi:CheY-like chemotaxis protein